MDAFYKGKHVTVHDVAGGSVEIYMTPWTVREYIDFVEKQDYILAKYRDNKTIVNINLEFIILEAIDKHIEKDKSESLERDGLINTFIELNFGEAMEPGTKKKSPKIDTEKSLSIAFDFLIAQGHRRSEIMDYTMPDFIAFQDAACKRLCNMYGGGKKKAEKMSVNAALDKMNIPIRN